MQESTKLRSMSVGNKSEEFSRKARSGPPGNSIHVRLQVDLFVMSTAGSKCQSLGRSYCFNETFIMGYPAHAE